MLSKPHVWYERNDPVDMIEWLRIERPHTSHRKLRLFACACYNRSDYASLPPENPTTITYKEISVDGQPGTADQDSAVYNPFGWANNWANKPPYARDLVTQECKAHLLRDIIGDPYRLMGWEIPSAASDEPLIHYTNSRENKTNYKVFPIVIKRAWRTEVVRGLADTAYKERCTNGDLDNDRLLVLSDALEDAGCEDLRVLDHLRSPEIHTPGCWVLDLLLHKE